jgi:hypothetical protein
VRAATAAVGHRRGAPTGEEPPLPPALPHLGSRAWYQPTSRTVNARGAVLVAWTIAAVVGIVGDLFVVPTHGIEGAAVVASLSYLLVAGLPVRPLLAVGPGATR